MRLSEATSGRLPVAIAQPGYDRSQAIGIVHFGIGAFHRAHQAWYTDACLAAGERGWMISGVSLRSPAVAEQLNPQDGLYTLTERSGEEADTRLIGAVREVIAAGADSGATVARIASADCHLVSFTITEKGYCRAPDGSLDHTAAAKGFYPLLTAAMRARMEARRPGLTLLSCDNLADNGRQLAALMRQWLEASAPDLLGWFDGECACPASMVDRIVPATTADDLTRLADTLGMEDAGAVFTERFSQWVIEDRFAGPRPAWERAGAQLVADVAPYETAKLRMLNGAHSALAYLGLERGYAHVHEAIAEPELRALIDALMRREAAPTIVPALGQDLNAYADALLERFGDPALNHRLAQIAMDGSQKIPQRWLATLADRQRRGCDSPALEVALSTWLRHLKNGKNIDDPLAAALQERLAGVDEAGGLEAIFGREGLLRSDWAPATKHA